MINKAILLSLTIAAGAIRSVGQPAPKETKLNPIANVRKQIEDANRKLSQNLAEGNIDGVAAWYTADAQFMVPNMPSAIGRPSIKAVYTGMYQSGATDLKLSTKELSGNGDLLEEVGTYTLSTSSGKQLDQGKYLVVWRKEATKWKLYRDCFNSDLPATKPQD
jgi:ketosteroid isomerase-like protein